MTVKVQSNLSITITLGIVKLANNDHPGDLIEVVFRAGSTVLWSSQEDYAIGEVSYSVCKSLFSEIMLFFHFS